MQQRQKIKSGAIVLREEKGLKYLLLIYRAKENDWSFPKGGINLNESPEEAVKREILEETGLKIKIIKELTPNIYLNSRTVEETITFMYLCEEISGRLKVEHEKDKLEWVELSEVKETLSYLNLKRYFEKIKEEL